MTGSNFSVDTSATRGASASAMRLIEQLKVNARTLLRWITITGLTAAMGSTISVSFAGQVGTTTGSFQVTAGGQSAYTMSVEVPPGIMGVVPQVAISYSSGGGNGLLGVGASLSGLSAISRCGSTIAQDGVAKPVQYNNQDYFCLNGQRLILMSGSYGAINSTYQTQLESFQKVTAKGDAGGGPAYFEVLAKGGSRLVFGKNSIERSVDLVSGAVASWSISYLQDKYGNRVDYHYEDAGNTVAGVAAAQILPKRISYGHNAAANVSGELAVEFVYQTRPDTATGYARGQKYLSDQRISNIQTFVGEDMVKDYRVAYELSPVSGSSRISTITECSGAANCLLPVSFDWHNYTTDWTQGENLPQAALNPQGGLRGAAVDVNNDGHTDWITAVRNENGQQSLVTYLNDNGVWSAAQGFNPPAPIFDYQRNADGVSVSELVDINGDGKVDWVQAYVDGSGTTNTVYINDGSDWVLDTGRSLPVSLADLSSNSNPRQLAEFIDLNGDALPDLVAAYRDSAGAVVKQTWLNTQTGWLPSSAFTAPDVLIDYQLYNKGAASGFFIDINNDGLSDFVKAYKNSAGTSLRTTWLNTGSGWQSSTAFRLPTVLADYSSATPASLASPLDINGDGLIDVVQAHQQSNGSLSQKVWLNKGNGWVVDANLAPPAIAWQAVGSTLQTTGLFVDLSNDGRPDFVQSFISAAGTSTNKVWRNTGVGWDVDNSLTLPQTLVQLSDSDDSYAKGFLIDANSDGRGDLLTSAGGVNSTLYLGGLNDNEFALPEVVTGFGDGLGNTYAVEYAPATYGGLYTPASDGVYPNIDVAGPMLLVAAVESAVGTNETSRAEHQYFAKKLNVLGRGDLGFARKKAVDTRSAAYIDTQFSQIWPFVGSPLSMDKKKGNGALLMQSTNSYASKELFGGKTFIVYQDSKTGSNYELNGVKIDTTINTTNDLDEYGNVRSASTQKTFYGSASGAQIYTSSSTTTFNNDVANWQIGRVERSTQSVSAPATPDITTVTAFSYYANGTLKDKIIEPDDPQSVTESYVYDDFGHITSTTIAATGITPRTTTATYTDDGRFAATATNPLGHSASSEYHSFFGQVTRTEGPNGSVTQKIYDDHGRMIKTTQVRTDIDENNSLDHASNVIVFHPCDGSDTGVSNANCPTNAAYFLGVVDNEEESPETVYYDNRNREVRKQTQGFDGSSVYVDTQYDSFGRKHKVSKPYFKDQTPLWNAYTYDLLGRVKTVTTAANKIIRSDYYPDRNVVTNPLLQTKTTWVNGQGKPIKVVDNDGMLLEFTYDAAGRLLTTVGNQDQSTAISLEYDTFGRKVKQNDPDLGEWEYRYDALGQLVWQQDAKDQVVTIVYDDLGRITQRTEAEGVTQWEYDQGAFGIGKLTKVWNDQGYQRNHVYDDYGRAKVVSTTIDGETTAITTRYKHTTDRVAYVEYPSGLKIAKTYNDYAFPLEIRSTSLDFEERYLAAEETAIALAEEARTYHESRAAERQTWLDQYEAEKSIGEGMEQEIRVQQGKYRNLLPKYNELVRQQRAAIDQVNRYEQHAQQLHQDADEQQHKALIYIYAAQASIALAEDKAIPWSSFEHIVENPVYLDELKRFLSFALGGCNLDNIPACGISAEDFAHTANWLAANGSNHHENAARVMALANAEYENMVEWGDVAQDLADRADTYYNNKLKPKNDAIDVLVKQIKSHYQIASAAAEEISTIDLAVKAKVDAASNAQLQAEALKNYHDNMASELHWRAESADAEGKITNFLQGKHVTTEVNYEAETGRLLSVLATSEPAAVEALEGYTGPDIGNRLAEFVTTVQGTGVEAAANVVTAQTDAEQTQVLIDALSPIDPDYSEAIQNAVQAQLNGLAINLSIHQSDVALNNNIVTLSDSTLSSATAIEAQYAALLDSTDTAQQTTNVLVYSARVHSLIASYHNQLQILYEIAAQQQADEAANIDAATATSIDPAFLQEYVELGEYHGQVVAYYQSRADAITPQDGSETNDPALYGLAKATSRQKKLISRHADVSNKRRRLNVAMFTPLWHLNNAAENKYCADPVLALHFWKNKRAGLSDRERFKNLEKIYRMRLAELTETETADVDYLANDTARKDLYQQLADINQQLSEMYTAMSSADYWDGLYDGFKTNLSDRSAQYSQLAANHHQHAVNNQLLASRSDEQYQHTQLGHDGTILNDTYSWDDIGNLLSREHATVDLLETFNYDALNRLTRSSITGSAAELYQLNGNATVTYEYDELGNIEFKSDTGSYSYADGAGPHAVTSIVGDANIGQKMTTSYQYDANGNMTAGDGRLMQYTSYNKPNSIERNGKSSQFVYGPERQLIKEVENVNGGVDKTTTFIGSQYQRIYDGYTVTEKYHISTYGGGTIAVIIDTQGETAPSTHYLHRDHLDSIVAITNERGQIVERFFYDAFGQQLSGVNTEGEVLYANTVAAKLTDRGYTGHKMITTSSLIHMKGRVYDPEIGRFLSADPHIQQAGNLQNYNRYSYVNNNPLAYNDPSGYFLSGLFKALKSLFKKIASIIKKVVDVIKKVVKFIKENLRVVIAIVVAVAVVYFTGGTAVGWAASLLGTTTAATSAIVLGGAITGAIAGGLSGLIMTGSLSGALKGAALGFLGGAIGGAVSSAGGGIGQGIASALKLGKYATTVGQGINAGVTGGIMGKITGGSFSKGFKNAVLAFGAFKGLDAISGGALTNAGNWLARKGQAFFGGNSFNLVGMSDKFLEGDVVSEKGDSRGLTEWEKNVSKEMFTEELNLDSVKLVHGTQIPGTGMPHVRFNKIWFPNGYPADFAAVSMSAQHTFVHEMTHIFQEQVMGVSLAIAKGKSFFTGGYGWKLGQTGLNIEQQASKVADYWAYSNGYTVEGSPLQELKDQGWF